MAKIIREREHFSNKGYSLQYDYLGENKFGFGFDCDENGVVNEKNLTDLGKKNLAICRSNENNAFEKPYIMTHTNHWVEEAVLECDCGAEVSLHGFTNTCECGADYNMSGQRLAPREFWGEETGETASDILNL